MENLDNIDYLRKEIQEFAFEMEFEMRKKDSQNYTHEDKSITFLIDKLFEKRDEVDECLIPEIGGKWNINKLINEELLHEGIMLVLLRARLKEEQLNKKE